jgi:hypothetical protein
MTETDIAYQQARERCQDLIGSLQLPGQYDGEQFTRALAQRAGNRVELLPLRLPDACAALWLGFTGVDRIGYNQDWPQHEIALAGHAIGHLLLGHCGEVRDGGQFACTAGCLDADDRRQLRRYLHDPADDRISRLFSDGEEHQATVFAQELAGQSGVGLYRPAFEDWSAPDMWTCAG